jgi:hypothetical protein
MSLSAYPIKGKKELQVKPGRTNEWGFWVRTFRGGVSVKIFLCQWYSREQSAKAVVISDSLLRKFHVLTTLLDWKGRRAAILAIIGFLAVLFTYVGVDFLLP